MVEFDEAYFSIPVKKGTRLKRSKGSQRKQNVAVMAESIPLEDPETGKKSRQCRYFKLRALSSHKTDSVNQVMEKLDERTIVFSDKAKNYVDIADHVEGHVTGYSDESTNKTTLKWVHIAISNAKRMFLGIYYWFHGSRLQSYLDEFTYKLNRRYFAKGRFDRLAFAVASNSCKQTT